MTSRVRAGLWLPMAMASVALAGGDADVAKPAVAKPAVAVSAASRPVNFSREVRPILSEHCFACHGPDEETRKAKLRLDTKDGVFGILKSGERAVVPGKVEDSNLVARIEDEDLETRMPPQKHGKPLSAEQIATLKRWVEQGASWSSHWAFDAPRKPSLPAVKRAAWPITPIDRFLLARLESEGLSPALEADRTTLIRRVTLDLTGLPPTPGEVDQFLADTKEGSYERLVNRLLESPRYGEHMARFWLDAARYGDTHGLHLDNYREIWPYREWVIGAFNNNMRFDQFVVEQLAGDLLPNATIDQRIATGFNRCHVSTSEGGSIEEEVYVRNVVDQVDTNGTVFLGLTTGCARCHDHKYDPIRAKDYYQLFAFFNNIDGPALDGNSAKWAPIESVPTRAQAAAIKARGDEIAALRARVSEERARAVKAVADEPIESKSASEPSRGEFTWFEDDLPPGATQQGGPWEFVSKPDQPVFGGKVSMRQKANGLTQHFFDNASQVIRTGEGDELFAYVYLDPKNPPKEIMLQWHASGAWSHRVYWGANVIPFGADNTVERLRRGALPELGKWVRLAVPVEALKLAPGTAISGLAFTQQDGLAYWDHAGLATKIPQDGQLFESFAQWFGAHKATAWAGLPVEIKTIALVEPGKRTAGQIQQLHAYFVEHGSAKVAAAVKPLVARIDAADQERKKIEGEAPTTLVYREKAGEPKPAFLLKRGEYDQRGDKVGRAVPAFLPPLPPGAPLDRLGLAQWLIAAEHPLTARVAVNRFWQQVFGTGIVKTAEDFGAQGEPPSHPELLDWLAVSFRESGWDVKGLMKQMVMSAAYRQSARSTPEALAKDPGNRLVSHGPRYRLDAEMLRDQALFVSGMLVERVGGPSVKPPQPAGLWEAVGFVGSNTAVFQADQDAEKVQRRSLYTFWKRTSPPPQMTTFDAPSRESCQVRRERTNTPLQALMLMNEPQFVAAARGLAERTLREAGPTTDERLTFMFRTVTARTPSRQDLADLTVALLDFSARYVGHAEDARRLIAIGTSRPDPKFDPGELAAWTMLGNVVLNLDEVLTKG